MLQEQQKKEFLDQEGYTNEQFKSEATCQDLKVFLLNMMIKAKHLLAILEMMNNVNFVIILKPKKKSLNTIENHLCVKKYINEVIT